MLTKRRHIWAIGLSIGVLIVIFFLVGPKKSTEERIAEDVAIVAREPWHTIHIQRVAFRGPQTAPTDAFVYGARPDGTPVIVQFVEGSPYTSRTAMRRLAEQQAGGMTAEFLVIPRSLVHELWRDGLDASSTHAGIALFVGVQPVEVSGDAEMEMAPESETMEDDHSEESEQEQAAHGNG